MTEDTDPDTDFEDDDRSRLLDEGYWMNDELDLMGEGTVMFEEEYGG